LLHIKGLAANKDKPMFHTIDDFLHVEYRARTRTAWLWASGTTTLKHLFQSLDKDANPPHLRQLAEKIVDERASSSALVTLGDHSTRDHVLEGSVTLLRDLDFYVHLRKTIREGDVGQLQALIPHLIFYFKGGGNGNYCKMMVEYMQWHLYEAPPEISEVIHNHCWLVNPSGRPGHFHPADELQEHNICDIKDTHAPIRANASWDYMTNISPAIPTFSRVGDHVDQCFHLIRGSQHTEPDAEADLQVLMTSF
ncbi:hypothetical protein BOTBODRAFT_91322, partial [Botryobasidium botryosum FD-172 SS1]